MTYWDRFLYASTLTAVMGAIFILVAVIFWPETFDAFFARPYWLVLPLFVVAYLLAPILSRYVRRK